MKPNKLNIQLIKFQQHGDERGMLVSLEDSSEIGFDIKRIYYMYDTKIGVRRGYHAHRHLQQVLICISGKCKIRLDNGIESVEVQLSNPYTGLFVDKMIWHEMYDFDSETVLMSVASHVYDEKDYIRDYQGFVSEVKNRSEHQ